jgi:hypothetical protein
VQPGEVRAPVCIAGNELAIEHGRFGCEHVQQLRDGRKTLFEAVPLAAVDGHAQAYLVAYSFCSQARANGPARTTPALRLPDMIAAG